MRGGVSYCTFAFLKFPLCLSLTMHIAPASRVSPSDEDAPGSPDSTFNAVNLMANEVNEQNGSNEATTANTAPSYPKTNAEGQRICRQVSVGFFLF